MKPIYLATIAVFLVSTQLFSQGTGITHYERKVKSISLQFPGEEYSSDGYLILVPDSIYSFGKIRVKKINFDFGKAKIYRLTFEENVVSNVEFILSGGKRLDGFLSVLNTRFEGKVEKTDYGFLVKMDDGKMMKCFVSKLGSKSQIRLLLD